MASCSDPEGERLDAPVLGLCEVRAGRSARAQMFHFDTAALVDFLTRAKGRTARETAAAATRKASFTLRGTGT